MVRLAHSADARDLALFASRTFEETFAHSTSAADMAAYLAAHYSEAIQRAEIDDARTTTLVASDGRALVGYAQIRDNEPPDGVVDRSAIELVRLYVDRAWHGRGLAIALMTRAEAAARDRGARTMWLGVWENNHRASAFYRKHGYVEVGEHVFMLGADAQRDLILAKPLELADSTGNGGC
ncbi:MAG TPA: GNAT family N-acetyltransferase [Vicinamibacterales bacterium]|nr:GNAT family N-acetyltransferase [Vicinamibacterales bacterium]